MPSFFYDLYRIEAQRINTRFLITFNLLITYTETNNFIYRRV